MNKDKVFINIYSAICTSNGFYESDMSFKQAVNVANSVVESLFAADLLLLKDESKQPQPPDFANTMLGEVPHEVSAEHQSSTQAVEGATPVVRQNEQTVKLCQFPICFNYATHNGFCVQHNDYGETDTAMAASAPDL